MVGRKFLISISLIFGLTVIRYGYGQNFCHTYSMNSEQMLQGRGRLDFDDGTYWEQVINGSFRYVRLVFNRTVDLYKIGIQTRINPEIRALTYDDAGNLQGRFYQLQSNRRVPSETTLGEQPAIRRLMMQGFDAQLTFDEVLFVSATVCAHNCRAVPGCFGECKPIEKDFGCVECSCPDESPSSGCSGIQAIDYAKLINLTRKKTPNCQYVIGYKRVVKTSLGIDDCISFSYPKCDFYRGAFIPKTRIECLKYCY